MVFKRPTLLTVHWVQTFNSCTSRPEICQCLVVHPCAIREKTKPSTSITHVACESKLHSGVTAGAWSRIHNLGYFEPNWACSCISCLIFLGIQHRNSESTMYCTHLQHHVAFSDLPKTGGNLAPPDHPAPSVCSSSPDAWVSLARVSWD